jgi:hypothetical protein
MDAFATSLALKGQWTSNQYKSHSELIKIYLNSLDNITSADLVICSLFLGGGVLHLLNNSNNCIHFIDPMN